MSRFVIAVSNGMAIESPDGPMEVGEKRYVHENVRYIFDTQKDGLLHADIFRNVDVPNSAYGWESKWIRATDAEFEVIGRRFAREITEGVDGDELADRWGGRASDELPEWCPEDVRLEAEASLAQPGM